MRCSTARLSSSPPTLAPDPIGRRSLVWASAPVLQTAAVAATGFVAGAATFALLRRYAIRAREAELLADGSARAADRCRCGAARTYIVHVRQIGRRSRRGPAPIQR